MSQHDASRFDLETAIATWRHVHARRRVFSAEDLDELERHLRDHTLHLVGEGLSEEAAFREAVQALGDLDGGEAEYRKVRWGKLRRRHQLLAELSWRRSMLTNYLKIAWRNLLRQKGHAFINVSGLAIGLAASFFILLWVTHELSFDRFHEKGDRLYRVMRHVQIGDMIHTWRPQPKPLAAVLEEEYPEVEHAMLMTFPQQVLLTHDNESFREQGRYVAPAFFRSFSFPLIVGDPASVINAPDAVAISERLARKLFGERWRQGAGVLGRTLKVNREKEYQITGVFEDPPENSSLQLSWVMPIEAYFGTDASWDEWGNSGVELYVLLKPGVSAAALNQKIARVVHEHLEGENSTVFLQPFEDMHLYSEYKDGQLQGGRITLVRTFGLVAVFLLVIASINFVNLSTARSTQRSKEIGVRKAVGATQRALTGQFLTESLLLTGVAFILALALVVLLLPVFNTVTGKQIGVLDLSPAFLAGVFGIALVTGVLAGSYPALYLSAFNPVAILRGTFRQKPGAARMRKGLVVFQFALSTLIIVSTAAVYLQIRYIMEKDLGLDRGNVVITSLEGEIHDRYESLRAELLKRPGIVSVTSSNNNPLNVGNSTTDPAWEGKDPDNQTLFKIINANYDFIETMKMELVSGRSFSRAYGADSSAYIINEQTAKLMGKENPLGETLEFWGRKGPVIGVVKDFHTTSLYEQIEPVIIRLEHGYGLLVRTEKGKTPQALAELEALYERFSPGFPFEYRLLDQQYEEMYRGVLVMGKLANVFAVIAVVISCLGLFGLASYTAERRTKEIGVRKVLGASVSSIVGLVSKEFVKLVAVAFVVGVPLAYLVMQQWLESFAYRVTLGPGLFLFTGVLMLLIALLTVSYQSIKAALADPVKSLRYE